MALSLREIRNRAIQFSNEWKDETRERSEGKTFLDQFFNVFGVSRRRISSFEVHVRTYDDTNGYIDLLWKGTLLVEFKSRGFNLDKAYEQAKKYLSGLPEKDLPKYILVSDFGRFRLYDLEENTIHEFKLKDFYKNIKLFGFISGYQKTSFKEQDPVNIHAAELMGKLHDKLKDVGYQGHHLEVYLVRLVFCLFADDTSIFEKNIFQEYLERNTKEDGSDLAGHLAQIFEVLNLPQNKRLTNLDDSLKQFPYVNGKLFEEHLTSASFDSEMHSILTECCRLDWGKISPAIFGSLFQSVMDDEKRRNLGAHYTSEKNILKLIKPLFLDALWKEFEEAKGNKKQLEALHNKIAQLHFLDPACGCGNFLIITYRELRLLEMEIIRLLLKGQQVTDIREYFHIDVDRFYGIEVEEFPSQIAQLAMWLIDHQMNMLASETFGEYYIRLPLKKSATILHGNALRLDWNKLTPIDKIDITADVANVYVGEPAVHYKTVNVLTKKANIVSGDPPYLSTNQFHFDYILGNPPFIGKHLMNEDQKTDMEFVFNNVNGYGVLDYVTSWYIRASQYLQAHNADLLLQGKQQIRCALVSTNSIAQGEQVGVLWNILFNKYKIKIHFAHRTFKWGNEAKGNAAVHVVIIGFSNFDIKDKLLYEYSDIKDEPHKLLVKNINPYLVDAIDLTIISRNSPLTNVPEMVKGSQPTDDGNLLMSDDEKKDYLKKEPNGKQFVKPFISAREFLHNEKRWCFWLVDANPTELKKCPLLLQRIDNIRKFRQNSNKQATVRWAQQPTVFTENRQPNSKYILIPRHSSESRRYIPFGFFNKEYIIADSCNSIPGATLYHFGILSSLIHNVWITYVCGRIKSDFRYSNDIVYNNFPWPENPSKKQVSTVGKAAEHVLEVRKKFPKSSLADLYDPNTMPPALVKSHQVLDKAVDRCYRTAPFTSEAKRVEYLFELYERYTAGLFAVNKKKAKK